MTRPVPYVSQVTSTALRGMDCGTACVLSMALWIDPAITATVDTLSRDVLPRQFDPTQDGTSAADLRAALSYLGLTPVAGYSGYPRIQLVHYPLLPKRYDTHYTKDHWIVRLSDTTYHDPLWRGTAGANMTTTKAILDAAEVSTTSASRIGIAEVPMDSACTPARVPYDRVCHVLLPNATEAEWMTVAKVAYPPRQSMGGSMDDACIVVDGMKSRTIICWNIPATSQAAYRDFVTRYYPSSIPTTIEFRFTSAPPPTYPTATITATPSAIAVGGASTVSWDAPIASSATLNGANVATTQTSTMKPAVTTTYTLVAKYPDASTQTKSALVTVTPVTPPPPPPPTGKILHGCHVRTDAEAARDAVARGGRCIQIMDHFDVAREIATAYPDAIVMHRKWSGLQNYKLTGSQIAALMEPCQGKVWITLLNEQDQYAYGTPAEIRLRAQVETDAARILLARGDRVLLGGFSMGTPNFLDPAICLAFKESYGAFLNADTTGRVGLNFHLYSPYPQHMQGLVRKDSGDITGPFEENGIWVFHIAAKTKNGDDYTIVVPASPEDVPMLTRTLDTGDDRVWYEGRWRFLYEPAIGLKPTIPIMSDEWGLDEGGVGGGPAHNWSGSDWLAWCAACTAYQSAPVVVNGVSYPSPLRGGTVFQCSAASGWEGYYVPPGVFQPVW